MMYISINVNVFFKHEDFARYTRRIGLILKRVQDIGTQWLITPEEYESERQIPGTIARPASKEGKVLYERSQ